MCTLALPRTGGLHQEWGNGGMGTRLDHTLYSVFPKSVHKVGCLKGLKNESEICVTGSGRVN